MEFGKDQVKEFWARRTQEAAFIGLMSNLWSIHQESILLFSNYCVKIMTLQIVYLSIIIISSILMMAGLMKTDCKINLVFVAYILMIGQVIAKIANFIRLDLYEDFYEELHFLAYAKGPLMLILLQTHFNHRYKKPI